MTWGGPAPLARGLLFWRHTGGAWAEEEARAQEGRGRVAAELAGCVIIGTADSGGGRRAGGHVFFRAAVEIF